MDLQDFEGQLLYFDEPMAAEVEQLLKHAAENYGEGLAENSLLKAFFMAPENLSVLVALYRFYYYQHRYPEAINIAWRAMAVIAPQIEFPAEWRAISMIDLANGVLHSFTMVRFYLLALKGAAYLQLRLGNIRDGVDMLNKVIELDDNDRLGARVLLQAMGPAVITVNSRMNEVAV
jgi:tetratricopeptide (TPR) repeat protein